MDILPKKMIAVGTSEILFCIKDTFCPKIMSAKFAKNIRDTVQSTFEGKGNHVYIFNKFQKYFYFFDDSNLLLRLTYDETRRKHKITG